MTISLFSQDPVVYTFIEQVKPLAFREKIKFGIPVSIKIAQAIHESRAGKSDLTKKSNNYFGIKCGSGWKGGFTTAFDDDLDANGNLMLSCFRGYYSMDASFRGHSEFLWNSLKYKELFSLGGSDYVSWAYGLKRSGYATDSLYAEKLIQIVEKYELSQLDDIDLTQMEIPEFPSELPQQVILTKDWALRTSHRLKEKVLESK
jgi:flagellum-specific peptidoglycan hydrolase FlgJ